MAEDFALSYRCGLNKKDLGKEVMVEGKDQMKEKEAENGKEEAYDEKNADRVSDTDETQAVTDGGNDEGPKYGEESSSVQLNLSSGNSGLAGQDEAEPSYHRSSHQNGSFTQILSGLRDQGNEGSQLDLLFQLNDLLSFGTVDSLRHFSVKSFVPLLVGFLNYVHNPDMMLLAARALTHLSDVLPSSCAAVVHYGAIPSFCACILTIEYIDLAEQALQALEKISHEEPAACLRAGALMAVLLNLDFFSTSLQMVAVSTAANICKGLLSDASDCVIEAIPPLTNVLQYQDSKVVEHASLCLMRIVETFASVPEKLDILFSEGLISQVAFVISLGNSTSKSLDSQTSFSTSTQTRLIRVLSMCASGSAAAAESLLLVGISSILKDSLAENEPASNTILPPALHYEIVTLVNELLPPMPESTAPSISNNGIRESEITSEKDFAAMASIDSGPAGQAVEETGVREKFFLDQPDLLVQFGLDLFPALAQVYGSSEILTVQKKCLAVIHKFLHFSGPEFLGQLLVEANISSFLVRVLASKNASILITTLQIAEILLQKNQDLFAKMFVKEGVLHAIDELIASFKPSRSGRRAVETAKHFKEKHFSRCLGLSDEGTTETAWTLKRLCAKLNRECADEKAVISGTKSFNEDAMAVSMSKILKELGSEDGLSTFEFEESGIVPCLLSYFGVGSVPGTKIFRHEAPQRFKQFIELSLPLDSNGKEVPFITLVRKLQNALASAERFPAFFEGANDRNGALGDDKSNESSEELEEHFTDEVDALSVDEYDGDYDEHKGKKAISNDDSDYNFDNSSVEDGTDNNEYDHESSVENGTDYYEHRGKNATSNEDSEANVSNSSVEDGTDNYDYDHDSSVENDKEDSDQESISEWTGPRVHDIIVGYGEDIETAGIEFISEPSCFRDPTRASGKQREATNAAWQKASWQVASILRSISEVKLPRSSEKKDSTCTILFLLRILEQLSRLAPRLRAHILRTRLYNLEIWTIL